MNHEFIWYELLTSDTQAATHFYSEILGWTVSSSNHSGMEYQMIQAKEAFVAGLMSLPPGAAEHGMQACWLGYISVSNLEAAIASYLEAGGSLHMPAMTVPGVGSFALVADPQGAALYLMQPEGDEESTSFAPKKLGHGGWHELHAKDEQAAFEFYEKQFSWNKNSEMDMGAMGQYILVDSGPGAPFGGIFTNPTAEKAHWLFYFNVSDIDIACQQIQDLGGSIIREPHQVPTGDFILVAKDPQGAMFALLASERKN